MINYLTLGGVFVTIPTCAAKVFGTKYGPLLYTIIVTGSALGSIFNILFAKVFIPKFGMLTVFIIGAVGNILAMVVAILFDENEKAKKHKRKGWSELKEEKINN